tara:strand:- start:350 stop:532 length:183 start_codon:yes stop_codon:yes gene_type:complete
MAFTRKVTPAYLTGNGEQVVRPVPISKDDALTQLSDIYRREAIGAFEDYRELIKEKSSVK